MAARLLARLVRSALEKRSVRVELASFVSSLVRWCVVVAGFLLQQPFSVGDAISVGDLAGTVVGLDLRATGLRTPDGREVIIPNGDGLTSAIVKYGSVSQRQMRLTAGVSYESDLAFVSQTAVAAIAGLPGVHADPAPDVVFDNLGPFTVDATIYYWIDTEQVGVLEAQSAATKAIKESFEQEGIEMPFPIQTVYVKQAAGSS